MTLYFNNEREHPIEVQNVSRELIADANGKYQIFVRIIVNERFNDVIAYCNSYASQDIVSMELYNGEELTNHYTLNAGRVNSIHEVVESTSQEVTMIIEY